MNEQQISYFVGIDIGTTAVRCVVGELRLEAMKPSIIGYAEIENSGMRRGNIAHTDEVAQAVINATNEAERMSGRQIKTATVNINGAHVQGLGSKGVIAISSANRQITAEDRFRVEEAATIVQLPPNKEIIQVFAKNYHLDGQDNIKDPIGMHGVRLEVDTEIVVASTPALKNLDLVLQKAEVTAAHRTVSGLAAAEATLDRKQKESGTAVLDIGASTTNLVVIEDGEIEHVAVIPMGGMHVTNDLAIGLKTELDIAETIKIKQATLIGNPRGETSLLKDGIEHHFDRKLMYMVVEARMEELLEFADKELKKVQKSKKLPGGIVLVGGGSKIPGMVEFTKEQMQLPARLGSWKHIERVVDGLDDQTFATPVGLMMLDMLLGPPAEMPEFGNKIFGNIQNSVKSLLKRNKQQS